MKVSDRIKQRALITSALAFCLLLSIERHAIAQMESTVVIGASGGAVGEAIKSEAERVGAAAGFKVQFVQGSSSTAFAKLQAQARAGKVEIDIMMVSLRILQEMKTQGLTAPLDMNALPAAKDLDRKLAFPAEVGAQPHGIRHMFALDVLAYNTDALAARKLKPPTSWTDIVNPEYASCTVLVNPIAQMNYIPLLNRALGGDYSNIGTTLEKMRPLKNKYVTIVDNVSAALEMLQQAKACITPNPMARVIEKMAAGSHIGYVIPKEGTSYLEGVYVIPKGAPHPKAAHAVLNALISESGMSKLRNDAFWTVSNTKVKRSDGKFSSLVPMVSDFGKLGAIEMPASAFDGFDDWSTKWSNVFAR